MTNFPIDGSSAIYLATLFRARSSRRVKGSRVSVKKTPALTSVERPHRSVHPWDFRSFVPQAIKAAELLIRFAVGKPVFFGVPRDEIRPIRVGIGLGTI